MYVYAYILFSMPILKWEIIVMVVYHIFLFKGIITFNMQSDICMGPS
jgi:hypothetical protein